MLSHKGDSPTDQFEEPLPNEKGTDVATEPHDIGALFHTWWRALGIDPEKPYMVGSRPVPLTEPGTEPIADVLA